MRVGPTDYIDVEYEVITDPRPKALRGPRGALFHYPAGPVSMLYGLVCVGLCALALGGFAISTLGPRLDPNWNAVAASARTPHQTCRARLGLDGQAWSRVDYALSGTPLKRLYAKPVGPANPLPVPTMKAGGCL